MALRVLHPARPCALHSPLFQHHDENVFSGIHAVASGQRALPSQPRKPRCVPSVDRGQGVPRPQGARFFSGWSPLVLHPCLAMFSVTCASKLHHSLFNETGSMRLLKDTLNESGSYFAYVYGFLYVLAALQRIVVWMSWWRRPPSKNALCASPAQQPRPRKVQLKVVSRCCHRPLQFPRRWGNGRAPVEQRPGHRAAHEDSIVSQGDGWTLRALGFGQRNSDCLRVAFGAGHSR